MSHFIRLQLLMIILFSINIPAYSEVKPYSPTQVLDAYLQAISKHDFASAYFHIASQDKKNKHLSTYLKENNNAYSPLNEILSQKSSYKILQMEKIDKQAKAVVEHSIPNFETAVPEILSALFTSVLGDKDEKKLQEMLAKKFENGIPIVKERKNYLLIQETDGWKIKLAWKSPQQRRLQKDAQLIANNTIRWETMVDIDEMTDEKIAQISTTTIEGKDITNTPYSITVRCKSETAAVDIMLNWGKQNQLPPAKNIQFRFDRDKMFEVLAQAPNEGLNNYIRQRKDINKIIGLMRKKKIMRIKHPKGKVGRYSLQGFSSAFDNACSWWLK